MTSVSPRYLQLAIFRLEEVCVRVQEGMEGFLRTAGLEKASGIEATFRWLRKRRIRIGLVTGYGREEAELLLDRLDWEVGEDGFIQLVVLRAETRTNPVRLALEHAAVTHPAGALAVVDTPRLLRQGHAAGVRFLLGVTSGSHRYDQLSAAPHHALLDGPLQLPNYLLRQLPDAEERAPGNAPLAWQWPGVLPPDSLPG